MKLRDWWAWGLPARPQPDTHKKEARHGWRRAGRWPVQLRDPTSHTSEEYVRRQDWRHANLECCPLHPRGGCGLERHGTYSRVEPPGMLVARWCSCRLRPPNLSGRLLVRAPRRQKQPLPVEVADDRVRRAVETESFEQQTGRLLHLLVGVEDQRVLLENIAGGRREDQLAFLRLRNRTFGVLATQSLAGALGALQSP